MTRHFCKFDETGKIMESYLDDGMPHEADDLLAMGCIEVSEEDFSLYMENGGNKYILGDEGKPVICEGFEDDLKEYWRTALKMQYDADRISLGTLILMADDEEEEAELQAKKIALKAKYEADLAKVEKGMNPLE